MAILTTQLKLDATNHDQNLAKAAREVKQYQQKVNGAKNSLGQMSGQVSKMGGALGAMGGKMGGILGMFSKLNPAIIGATTAIGGVVAVMRNNEQTMDNWRGRVQGIQTAYESLLTTINTGDWANVWDNFWNAMERGRDAYNAADAYDTYKGFNKEYLTKLSNEILNIQNQMYEAQREGRQKDVDNLKKTLKEKNDLYISSLKKEQQIKQNEANTLLSSLVTGSLLDPYTTERLADKYLSSGDAFNAMLRKYDQKIAAGLKDNSTAEMQFMSRAKKLESKLREPGGYIDQRNEILAYTTTIEQATKSLNKFIKMEAKAEPKPTRIIKTKQDQTPTSEPEQQSKLEELNKLLKELNKEREKLYTIDNGEVIVTDPQKLDEINQKIKETTDSIERLNYVMNPQINIPSSGLFSDPDEYYESIEKLKTAYDDAQSFISTSNQKIYGNIKDISSGMNELINVWSSWKNILNSNNADFADYFSAITSSIFGTIDAIAKITTAVQTMNGIIAAVKAAQAVTDKVVGQAELAEMAAKVVAFYASLGPAGLAPAASTIAAYKAMATAGAFADGGIVGGHSMVGDKLLARVNSGELILNRQQQASLLSQLEANNIVTFKIEGSTLVGAINNYNRKQGRGR